MNPKTFNSALRIPPLRNRSLVWWVVWGAILSGCSRAVPLKVVAATRIPVESTLSTTSSGTVDAQQQAILGFTAMGRIAQVTVVLGAKVKAGQTLARLDNTDLLAISRDAATENHRNEELFASGLISRTAMDEAKRNVEVARVNLSKTVIVAPFDGIVTELNLQVGELSQSSTAGKAPIRLIDLKPRVIKGEIDEIDLAKVKMGSPARIKIMAVRAEPFAAVVTRVVPFVSTTKEQDRTSQIELKITEPDSAIPVGASADVEVVVDIKPNALAVPTRAVLGTGDGRYLYAVRDGKLVKTQIKAGAGNYDRLEILSGIEAGTEVALPADNVELKDGLKVTTEKTPWP